MSSWPTDLLWFTVENHNNYLCIIPQRKLEQPRYSNFGAIRQTM